MLNLTLKCYGILSLYLACYMIFSFFYLLLNYITQYPVLKVINNK